MTKTIIEQAWEDLEASSKESEKIRFMLHKSESKEQKAYRDFRIIIRDHIQKLNAPKKEITVRETCDWIKYDKS